MPKITIPTLLLLLASAGILSGWDDGSVPASTTQKRSSSMARMDEAKFKEWLARWEKNITTETRNRYCDSVTGEDIGWLMSPFMEGFRNGFLITRDTKWIDLLVDWTDSWLKRAVKEPDGFMGWPKIDAAGTKVDKLDTFTADSMLGEAMALQPIVLMSGEILKTPSLNARYGSKAESYLKFAEQIYQKWEQRGGWRETRDGGMISLVMPYGLDAKTGDWTSGYTNRNSTNLGFSHPNNKANLIACWLLAMSDATGKPVYRERAEKWFRLMKSRLKPQANGSFQIWNYWQPAGAWDYLPNGSPKHWIGVHPTKGYYAIDADAIVNAVEHHVVFNDEDLSRLILTATQEHRYWPSLAAYSTQIQAEFEKNLKPDSWDGISLASHYLALQAEMLGQKLIH